jgi:hypothetical protein
MVSERWVESRHSLLKRSLMGRPSVSAAFIACQGIMTPLRKLLVEAPQALDLERLATLCMDTRHASVALKSMGLYAHPSIQKMLTNSNSKTRELQRSFRPEVVRIIYHVDNKTLYQDLPAACVPPPPAPAWGSLCSRQDHA